MTKQVTLDPAGERLHGLLGYVEQLVPAYEGNYVVLKPAGR